jgi:hypothetical protein
MKPAPAFPRFLQSITRPAPWLRRLFSSVALGLLALSMLFAPGLLQVQAGPEEKPAEALASNIVISEFRVVGSAGGNDEFVEIFNPTQASIDITGWTLVRSSSSGVISVRHTFGSVTLAAGQYYLVAGTSYDDSVPADVVASGGLGIATDGGLALRNASSVIVDQVGMSPAPSFVEGTPLLEITSNVDRGYARVNVCEDTNNNAVDFVLTNPSQSQNSTSPIALCPAPSPTPPWEHRVVINEVAWGGTQADDIIAQWIELWNPSLTDPVDLTGWYLRIPGKGDIPLSSSILPNGYYLIERNQLDTSVPAGLVFAFPFLDVSGDRLFLYSNTNDLVDSANADGGPWPAGNRFINYASMERRSNEPDVDSAWLTFNAAPTATDRLGNPINGSPGAGNVGGATSTPTPTATATSTATATLTPTVTFTPSLTPTSAGALFIIISEVAWAGTGASANDEWIELYNPNNFPVSLAGWRLRTDDGSPNITLTGTIPALGYYLLERTDDTTVSDVPANQFYTGELSNTGEILRLLDPSNIQIDTANQNGGAWPAGSVTGFCSMERYGLIPDTDTAWATNNNLLRKGLDADGDPICGTPGQHNWAFDVTATLTPTITSTPTRTNTPVLSSSRDVIINEVAWMGTQASADDEWIELYNPGTTPINLTGWRLVATDNSFTVTLAGTIAAQGYFLLERTDNDTVKDIAADQIYTSSLANTGKSLRLLDAANRLIDTANSNGGAWPAGNATTYCTMERRRASATIAETDSEWITNTGVLKNGTDSAGNAICGTPRNANWAYIVTPTPTPARTTAATRTPTRTRTPTPFPAARISQLIINEFLPHPRTDWNKDGQIDSGDEFIEIMNVGNQNINLQGWRLDDQQGDSSPFTLSGSIAPGARMVFFAKDTGILLSNRSDSVRLFLPSGALSDAFTYTTVPIPDQTWCRLPDGGPTWFFGCQPTLAQANKEAETVMRGEVNLPAICSSPRLPLGIFQAECQPAGLDAWARSLWDGRLPIFQVFFEYHGQQLWVE